MAASKQSETRRFTVSPHIIYSLIKAQAGTLAKAVLECVMNSVDAGATKVDIVVSNKALKVVDDGSGFSTRDSILACFEEFGFEHAAGDRTYGQFGIGRAQLWNFCKTKWLTRTFSMDVDIKNKGLDYQLVENLADLPGLTIEGLFYTTLKTSEVLAFEQEFAFLAMYAQVPVTVNGKMISKDPRKEKWTHETPDAWINVRESGNLDVFNLGVYVREYPAYQVGSGGKIVTKPGVRLSLNMARNDILLTECKVWKRIKPFLQRESDKRIKDSNRKMTDAELDNMATRYVAGELTHEDVAKVKFIVDIHGKGHTLCSFIKKANAMPVITGAKDSQVMDRAHQLALAFVVNDATLSRFGVDSPSELGKLFMTLATQSRFCTSSWHLNDIAWADDANEIVSMLNDAHLLLNNNELSKDEQIILRALNGTASRYIRWAVRSDSRPNERSIRAGTSDIALAWTDGASMIAIERKQLKLARKGLPGMQALVNILVHEYLHDSSSAGSHMHDGDFHQRFHDILTNPQLAEQLGCAAQTAFREMVAGFREHDIPLIKAMKDGLDLLDDAADIAVPELSLVPAVEVAVLENAPSKTGTKLMRKKKMA